MIKEIKVQVGDEVKDKITGFKGIAIVQHIYMQGCDRFTVINKSTRDKPEPTELSFDEPDLVVTKAKKVVGNGDKAKGGPTRHIPKPKSTEIKK